MLQGLNLCTETLDGIRNHSWSRPAPLTVEGNIVSWADRIAYCAHDLEDAIHAGIVAPDDLPAEIVEVCGRTRREQLNTFVRAVVRAVEEHGEVAMPPDEAGRWRRSGRSTMNVSRRPALLAQSRAVVEVLRALVEHYSGQPDLMPDGREISAQSDAAMRAAVTYVAGMTDRYAFDMAPYATSTGHLSDCHAASTGTLIPSSPTCRHRPWPNWREERLGSCCNRPVGERVRGISRLSYAWRIAATVLGIGAAQRFIAHE